MKAVILAAGLGSRLGTQSKPLTSIAGVALIQHVIAAAAEAGITDFVVVTGHFAAPLNVFLHALAPKLGVTIERVRTGDWTRPNGWSVLTGAAKTDGDYLLMMSDHLFDPAIVRALIGQDGGPDLVLAVDRDLTRPELDLDDATKVKRDAAGRIVAIGKTLADYDAIDTGLFRAGPALAEALEEAIAAGGAGSLSEGVQRLADQGRASTLDVTGRFWLDVDDPGALAHAEAMLSKSGS